MLNRATLADGLGVGPRRGRLVRCVRRGLQIALGEGLARRDEVGVGRLVPQPERRQRARLGGPGGDRRDVPLDRRELGRALRPRVVEPVVVLEGHPQRGRGVETRAGRGRLHVRPKREDALSRVDQCRGVVELPCTHRVADRLRHVPILGVGEQCVVLGTCRGPLIEQRKILGARDPRPPQVLVGRVGASLEQVEQSAPIWRSRDGLGAATDRLVRRRPCRRHPSTRPGGHPSQLVWRSAAPARGRRRRRSPPARPSRTRPVPRR